MKTDKITKIIVISAFIAFMSIIIAQSFIQKRNDNNQIKFMILNTYSNYAWGMTFNGSVIYDDGTIYTWNETSQNKINQYNIGTAKGLKEYIVNEATKSNKKVNENDLNNLKKYIGTLKDDIKINYPGADQGTTTISVITENNEEIILKKTGDSVGENKTYESQAILEIVEKYLK